MSEKYSYSSLAKIQSNSILRQELIDHIIVFENYPIEKEIRNLKNDKRLSININDVEVFEQTNYNFNVTAIPGNELIVKLTYNSQLYSSEFVENIMKHFNNIVNSIIENQNIMIDKIEILAEAEKNKLLLDFNNKSLKYASEKTFHELFEQQVEKKPDNIAVVYEDNKLTYRELFDKSNRLARILRKKGIKPNTIVGLMASHSIETVIGILGILKAGGAYLPIDPNYPSERISYMLQDSDCNILLTNLELHDSISSNRDIIDLNNQSLYVGEESNLKAVNKPNDLVYVIYTSGSTGKPKGTMIEHQGLVNYIHWSKQMYVKNENEVFPLYSSLAFDLTVTSIFTPLISGSKIIIYSDSEDQDEYVLYRIMKENKATVIKLTPSHLSLLKDMDNRNSSVKRFIVGGEDLKVSLAKDIHESFGGNIEIFNEYGPTETVVGCMIHKYNYENDLRASVPIGIPANNVQIYILDKNFNPVPLNIVGEIYISGDGVARGYLNRPDLTEEKFIANSFINGRLYKTGDLARFIDNDKIEYAGRVDQQVKIRGYRIELGEIDNILNTHPQIEKAVVVDKTDMQGNKYLCAYMISKAELDIRTIKEYLSKKLPNYMVPTYLIQMDNIPLTPNGKIDKKSLRQLEMSQNIDREYIAPRNKIEELLISVWKEVLAIDKIGIEDKFFELGGDSIKAIQLTSRLYKHKLKLEVKDLFIYPTIAELSSHVKSLDKKYDQGMIEGETRLTPIQEYFFEKRFTDMHHFNQSVMLFNRDGFSEEFIRKVFNKLVEHHDALRLVYRVEEEIVQYNRNIDDDLFDFEVIDLDKETDQINRIEEEANRIQASIDLTKGPLVKLALFKTSYGDHFLIVIHHLVVDGVSWRILLEDFKDGYIRITNNEDIRLPDKTVSFKEWGNRLREYAESGQIKEEIIYWKKIEETYTGTLPKDFTAYENNMKCSKLLSINLSEEHTEKLLKEVNKAYNTEINDILLTALGMTVKEWTGENKVLINLEGHGREEIIEDIDITRTVGWFTSNFPVILDMSKSESISYQIKLIKENLRHVPNKGIGYEILRYLTSKKSKRDLKFNTNPEISFNYLGQLDNEFNTSLFKKSDLPMGLSKSLNSERAYVLDINAVIVNQQFVLYVDYNKDEYRKDTILKLIESYKKNLEYIIDHCSNKEETELTPTDLGNEELTIEEVEEIQDIFNIL